MTRRERERRKLEAEIAARARITPDESTRSATPPARINSAFRAAIDAYRQTPEPWAEVWADDKERLGR